MSEHQSLEPLEPDTEAKTERQPGWLSFFACLLIFFGAQTAIAEPRYIPSGSMLPGLQIQDRLLVEKVSLKLGPPRRGDILVFELPDRPAPAGPLDALARWQGYGAYTPLIKRVIGLPGEVLEVRAGKVFIDGRALAETGYRIDPPRYRFGPIRIPAGHLFMMGDNRNNSADSHVWGPLPLANIRGKAVIRFWPLNQIGPLD